MITPFSVVPSRQRPAQFAPEMDQFLGEMARFVTEANALEQSLQVTATTGTSTSALSVVVGSVSIQTQGGKAWVAGAYVYVCSAASVANIMHGQVVSYNVSTGALVVNVLAVSGAGTFSNWVIGLAVPMAQSMVLDGSLRAASLNADAQFFLSVSLANRPYINFSPNVYIEYDRGAGFLTYVHAGVARFWVSPDDGPSRANDAVSGNGLVRKAQLDQSINDATQKASAAQVQAGSSNTLLVTPQTLQTGKRFLVEDVSLAGLSSYAVSSIPSWVTRITVSMHNVSTSADQLVGVRVAELGNPTSFYASGYVGNAWRPGASANISTLMAVSNHANQTDVRSGSIVLTRIGSRLWASASLVGISNVDNNGGGAFSVALTDPLAAVQFVVASGVFDSGVISVMWE